MGSAIHAKSLKERNIEVGLMISLEMLGYYSNKKGSQEYPISILKIAYPNKGNFIAAIGKFGQGKLTRSFKKSFRKATNFPIEAMNAPALLTGIDFSDHRNYWAQGYPALMLTDTSFYRNKNYHQTSDTIDTLNFEAMAKVLKGTEFSIRNF